MTGMPHAQRRAADRDVLAIGVSVFLSVFSAGVRASFAEDMQATPPPPSAGQSSAKLPPSGLYEPPHPQLPPSPASPPSKNAAAPAGAKTALSLEQGELRRVAVDNVERIAIGDPDVLDLTVVSPTEVLLQAKAIGKTNVIVWDRHGQTLWDVSVVDRAQEGLETAVAQLVQALKLPHVIVKAEHGRVFVVGDVGSEAEAQQVERALEAFPGVVNVVRIIAQAPTPPVPAPLVRLAVQVIDVSRSDLDQLGINWSQSLAYTGPSETSVTFMDALTRIGTTLNRDLGSRGSVTATLNALVQQNRARILAEPKLVTASGKQASSFVGVEVPIIKATSFGSDTGSTSASIEFRETGVVLTMTPLVNPSADAEHKITTTVQAEVSSVDSSVALSIPVGTKTIAVPGFKVRKANTEVTTASGESIVIAGLLQSEDTFTNSQVPALGSIPVMGRLFKAPKTESSQRELVIVVTPDLLGPATSAGAGGEKQTAVEQALAVAEVSASETVATTAHDPILRYAMAIQERIAKAIHYPGRERDRSISGQVKLKLHLFSDGTLGRALISESSGIEAFDLEALKAAEVQAPYPPFPPELSKQKRELWLELPVVFRP